MISNKIAAFSCSQVLFTIVSTRKYIAAYIKDKLYIIYIADICKWKF